MKARYYSALFTCLACTCALADEAAPTLQTISVTASGQPDEDRRAAVTQKTILDRAAIEALGGLSIGEVIRKLPGIDAGAYAGDGNPSANVRGLGRDAVQFLVDGERPTANSRYALTNIARLPAGELERVEILRGASAETGGAAPITVNLLLKKARAQASRSVRAAVGVRGNEFNSQLSASLGGGEQGFAWLLPLTYNHHGMPLEKQLQRQAFSQGQLTLQQHESETSPYTLDEFIVSPRLSWREAGSQISLWPSLYHNQGEKVSHFQRQPASSSQPGSVDWDEQEDSQLTIARVRLEGETRAAGGKLSGRVALMDGRRNSDTQRQWLNDQGLAGRTLEQLRRDENELSSSLRLDRAAGDGMVSLGLEQGWLKRRERQQISGSQSSNSDDSSGTQQWSLWAQHEWQPQAALTLTAGLRGETLRLESETRVHRASQLAPSLAARYDWASDLVLRASIGSGIKTPKLEELSALSVAGSSYNSPLEPDRAGNPELQAERNVNLELALDKHLPADTGVLGANLYLRRTHDFIERRAQLETGRWVERPYNLGLATHYGLELDAKLKTERLGLPGGALRSHLTLPQGRVDDPQLGQTRMVRDLPRYQWSLGHDQSLPAWQMSAGFLYNLYGRSRTAIGDELNSSQYARGLLDIYLLRRLTPQLNLRLEAQNLLQADLRRLSDASAGSNGWTLASSESGQTSWLATLEGKW